MIPQEGWRSVVPLQPCLTPPPPLLSGGVGVLPCGGRRCLPRRHRRPRHGTPRLLCHPYGPEGRRGKGSVDQKWGKYYDFFCCIDFRSRTYPPFGFCSLYFCGIFSIFIYPWPVGLVPPDPLHSWLDQFCHIRKLPLFQNPFAFRRSPSEWQRSRNHQPDTAGDFPPKKTI